MKAGLRGFTLVELLVVIAIIGIIATISLAMLSGARNKGIDAKVKTTLSSVRSRAELFNTGNSNSYNGSVGNISGPCNTANSMFTDSVSGMSATLGNLPAGSTATCWSTASAYAVSATLPGAGGTNSWCVDSTGAVKGRGTAITSVVC